MGATTPTTSHPPSLSNVNVNSDSSSIMTARKKSKDYENSIYSNHYYTHNTDLLTTEDNNMKYGNERKKSGGSNNSKGKDREKSEGSLLFLSEVGKNDKVL